MLRAIWFFTAVLLLAACDADVDPQSEAQQPAEPATTENLFPVRENGMWGYIDESGDLAIDARFERAWQFSDGYALVKEDGSYGYIRPDGGYALDPQFDDAWHFANGLAPVELDGEWSFVDTTGEVLADTQINFASGMLVENTYDDDAFHLTRSDGQYGFSTSDGEQLIEPRFEQAWRFSDGLARVKSDGKWGYIDKAGNFAIEPRFDIAWDFREGLAMVQAGDTVGYINREGQYVWPEAR